VAALAVAVLAGMQAHVRRRTPGQLRRRVPGRRAGSVPGLALVVAAFVAETGGRRYTARACES
jgi:hypothetical protein